MLRIIAREWWRWMNEENVLNQSGPELDSAVLATHQRLSPAKRLVTLTV